MKEHETLRNALPESERGRPMPLGGTNGHSHAEPPDRDAQRLRWFAHEVAIWPAWQVRKHAIEELVVLAPPKMLGALRKEEIGPSSCRVHTRKGEMAHLNPDRLAEQPLIMGLLADGA